MYAFASCSKTLQAYRSVTMCRADAHFEGGKQRLSVTNPLSEYGQEADEILLAAPAELCCE